MGKGHGSFPSASRRLDNDVRSSLSGDLGLGRGRGVGYDWAMNTPVEVLDATLRDGSYIIDFQFTAEDTALICSGLESAGIRLIEIGHGLGLGAARAGKGDQAATDEAYLRAARDVLREAQFGAFFIPGVGAADDLRMAADHGMHFVRIGTNITELHEAAPFVELAKGLGFTVSCNLMKSYAVPAETFAARAREAEGYGADIVCLVDSAGGMLPEDVRAYSEAALAQCGARLGFHGHDNLRMAIANSLAALEAGASIVDSTLQGMGRSAGNAVTEVLVAILQKRGQLAGADVNALLNVGEGYVRPLMHAPGCSAIGVTTGRAKFHSSFLGRVTKAAAEAGVDARELILRLGARDQINAPEPLVAQLAAELAAEGPRSPVRVDIAAAPAETPREFGAQVRERALELREKGRKHALPTVLNIVATPYELTRVSPFVDVNYGCALSNVMLAEAERLPEAIGQADGLIDYILLDPGPGPVPWDAARHTTILTYLDHEMWARAALTHLTILFGGSVAGKRLAVTGVPPLAFRAAQDLAESGAETVLDAAAAQPGAPTPAGIPLAALADVLPGVDAAVALSPRRHAILPGHVEAMPQGSLLYDGGIGSIAREAIPAAERRGIRVVRVDMRPSLAATALERIGMKGIVEQHMGRAEWNGVAVVAGGLIGREGDIIVDSIHRPTRVIGVADGMGGIVRPEPGDPRVHTVRQSIAVQCLDRWDASEG